jgi:superfamily II DNA/RNA helicase
VIKINYSTNYSTHVKIILFVKTQCGVDRLADNPANDGVLGGALHGGKSQAVRTRTLILFKEQENAALVATAARGIHVEGISLVCPRRCANRSQKLSTPL